MDVSSPRHPSIKLSASGIRRLGRFCEPSLVIPLLSTAWHGHQMGEYWPLAPLIRAFASGIRRLGRFCEPSLVTPVLSLVWHGHQMGEYWPLAPLIKLSASGTLIQDNKYASLKD